MNEFSKAFISTTISTIILYPLDIIRTNLIVNNNTTNLFKGLEGPLLTKSCCEGMEFWLFNKFRPNTCNVFAAIFTGFIMSFIKIPLETYKISRQLNKRYTLNYWRVLFLKENIGSSVYLPLICILRNQHQIYKCYASIFTMTLIYPLDTIYITHSYSSLWKGYNINFIKVFLGKYIFFSIYDHLPSI